MREYRLPLTQIFTYSRIIFAVITAKTNFLREENCILGNKSSEGDVL